MRMKKKHNEKRPRSLSAGVLVTALLLTAGCGTVLANQTETALEEPVDEIKDQELLDSKEDIERDLYDMLEKRARGSGVFFAPEQAAAEEKFFADLKRRAEKRRTVSLPNEQKLEMIWIEPSTFTMGSTYALLKHTSFPGNWKDVGPHGVTLTKEYWLGKCEVTQGQYEAIMGKNPSHFKGADLPVETVSWFDAMEFCKKLTTQERAAERLPEGYEYTLPTEAQWECACWAGTKESLSILDPGTNTSMGYFGSFWFDLNSHNTTHPVGQSSPNLWSLYDMVGNVWEWCLDNYDMCEKDYPRIDPKGAVDCSLHVYHGGSWFSSFVNCRASARRSNAPGYQNIDLGFRVALVPVQ